MKTTGLCFLLGGLLTVTCGAESRDAECPYRQHQSAECFADREPQPPQDQFLAFSATWCEPCRQMAPLLDSLEQQGICVQRIDVDQDPALVKKYHINALPTLIRLVDGIETGRIVGIASQQRISQLSESAAIQPALASCPACDCDKDACVPAATNVQPLLRASYAVPQEQAKALVELLQQNTGLPVEAKIDSHLLTITTTPAAQRTIGAFVDSFLSNSAE